MFDVSEAEAYQNMPCIFFGALLAPGINENSGQPSCQPRLQKENLLLAETLIPRAFLELWLCIA
ncbi:hypothetical protein PHLCEN_2v403 [Hermanssonia centrifuga]|uniref:Uncharacterized protein n=1 Tax=Hermanssonia centrifuga TaxID=98765 RepID=A0A2R6S5X9_9APHY|nr:hypothetical protein PHLCEN_2v403 [Hermanssonia centrifuga]